MAGTSARAWLAGARTTTAHLRSDPGLGVPPAVLDHFEAFLTDWEAAADGEEFRWAGDLEVEVVRIVAAHWVRVANLLRERPDLARLRPPPEADRFYDALIAAIADVLARAEEPDFAASFASVVPDFAAEAGSPTETVSSTSPYRVVLVDDTDDIRTLLRIGFDLHPAFEVVGEAGDGRHAIDVCGEQQPDVVILDLRMPVMDGLTALPRLRDTCPRCHVIVFSADGGPEERSRAAELGAAAFLAKGTSIPEVIEEVTCVLRAASVGE